MKYYSLRHEEQITNRQQTTGRPLASEHNIQARKKMCFTMVESVVSQ